MNSPALQAMIKAYKHRQDKNKNFRTQWEFDGIVKNVTKDFWNDEHRKLLEKQKHYSADSKITINEAVLKLRKELRNFAHENNLGCTFVSELTHFYISLLPCQIHVQVERETGSFSISTPNIATKNFFYDEWQLGLKWIQDYLAIDDKILKDKIQNLKDQIYLSTKSAEIAIASISSVSNAQAAKMGMSCKISSSWLKSRVSFYKDEIKLFEIMIYHKTFLDEPSQLSVLIATNESIKFL